MSMSWSEVFSVVFTGISVVFLALVALVFIVFLVGKIFENIDKSKARKQEAKKTEQKAEQPKSEVSDIANIQVVGEGISAETVAAITAAITCVMDAQGEGKPFIVRNIKRSGSGRNLWNQAGIAENTRPF